MSLHIKKNGLGLISALFLAFLLGHYTLESIGIQYVSDGGNPVFKIHLYSYMLLISVTLVILKLGANKVAVLLVPFGKAWLLSLFFFSIVVIYALMKFGISGLAYLIDTILVAIVCLVLVFRLDKELIDKTLVLLAWLVLFNSTLAIAEMLFQSRLLTTDYGLDEQFRSTALLNHPLNNALITASLTPLLYDKTRISPLVYLVVIFLALFAFGGRTALAVFSILNLFIVKKHVEGLFRAGSINKISLFIISSIVLMATISLILINTSIGARVFGKLALEGSAQARLDLFVILRELSLSEWFFGARSQLTSNLDFYIGIGIIENYLIGWLMSYGAIIAFLLFLSSHALLFKAYVNGALNQKIAIISFVLISIANNSLAAKTPALLFLYVAVFCTFRLAQQGNLRRS